MLKIAYIALSLPFFLMSACVVSQERLRPEVADFIELLVRVDEPTLAEYAKFSGECGGESELEFELKECESKGWDTHSESCIAFTRQRCEAADQLPSLRLSWLRKRFSTIGKSHQLISVQDYLSAYPEAHYVYDGVYLVEVKIGENTFLLYNDTHLEPILGGIAIRVSEVNDRAVADYLKND